MSVLLTDGGSRQTLAVVRSLGQRGIRTVVGDTPETNLASVSRYCSGRVPVASPTTDPSRFQDSLVRAVATGSFELLIPVSDAAITASHLVRTELERYVSVALPRREPYKQVTDKARLLSLAGDMGIPTPRTFQPGGPEDVRRAAREIGWPVVVKPRLSKTQVDERWLNVLVGYARTEAELQRKWFEINGIVPLPLLQERIVGPGLGIFILAHRGRLLAWFAHRRLRERPPSGGVSVLRESVVPDPELLETARALAHRLSWTGVAMLEFKRDHRDGVAKLIEVNARLWGSLQLAIDAGVDFPYLLYRAALGDPTVSPSEPRIGIRSRWLLGDLDHLLSVWLVPRRRLHLPSNHSRRLRTLVDFVSAFGPRTRTEVLRLNDPRPFLHEMRTFAAKVPRAAHHVLSRRPPRPTSVRGG